MQSHGEPKCAPFLHIFTNTSTRVRRSAATGEPTLTDAKLRRLYTYIGELTQNASDARSSAVLVVRSYSPRRATLSHTIGNSL